MRTLVAECWLHGKKTYWLDLMRMRFRCPVDGCEAFISAEAAEALSKR